MGGSVARDKTEGAAHVLGPVIAAVAVAEIAAVVAAEIVGIGVLGPTPDPNLGHSHQPSTILTTSEGGQLGLI